jgi:hypothetical protein
MLINYYILIVLLYKYIRNNFKLIKTNPTFISLSKVGVEMISTRRFICRVDIIVIWGLKTTKNAF